MYLKEYFPFYTTYANPLLYEGERMQDKEFNLMKSYYPGTVQHIQEKIEEECDLMDYEGSRLYDEYPDKYMIYHLSCKIRESTVGFSAICHRSLAFTRNSTCRIIWNIWRR